MAKKANLVSRLSVDASNFVKNIARAKVTAFNFTNQTDTKVGKLGKSFATLSKGVAIAGVAITGVVASVTGLGIAVAKIKLKNVFDLGGRLSDLATRLDVGAGNVLKLERAVADSGGSVEGLGKALDRLTRRVSKAVEANNEYRRSLEDANVSAEELAGLGKVERFLAFGRALERVEDKTVRTRVAMDLLGTSAGQLSDFFANSSTAISNAEISLGGQIEILNKHANTFDRISDLLSSLKDKSQGFFVGVGASIEKPIVDFLEAINKKDFSKEGQAFGRAIMDAAQVLGRTLSDLKDLSNSSTFQNLFPEVVNTVKLASLFAQNKQLEAEFLEQRRSNKQEDLKRIIPLEIAAIGLAAVNGGRVTGKPSPFLFPREPEENKNFIRIGQPLVSPEEGAINRIKPLLFRLALNPFGNTDPNNVTTATRFRDNLGFGTPFRGLGRRGNPNIFPDGLGFGNPFNGLDNNRPITDALERNARVRALQDIHGTSRTPVSILEEINKNLSQFKPTAGS